MHGKHPVQRRSELLEIAPGSYQGGYAVMLRALLPAIMRPPRDLLCKGCFRSVVRTKIAHLLLT